MSAVATVTMSDATMQDSSSGTSMAKYYASKIGELNEVSQATLRYRVSALLS
jgi:hypothetical protein